MADSYGRTSPCTAPELLLKVVLTGTQSHYENRGIIDDKRLDHLLTAGKQILFKSHQESDVRQNLGFSPAIWQGLTSVLSVAIPSFEHLCFIYRCSNPQTYNNSSSELVAANCITLVKEIERLNDLCTIARNLLATTKRAQNLAADRGFDQQVLKLIDVCVKVTARGFDGTNVRVEERHQKVCNLFKRLLITCLQFLHNFIMHNEHRKLVLWLDLFGNAPQQTMESNGDNVESDEQVTASIKGDGVPLESGTEPTGMTGVPTTAGTLSIDEKQERTVSEDSKGNKLENRRIQQHDSQPGSTDVNHQGQSGKLPYTIDDVTALFDVMNGEGGQSGKAQDAAKVLMERIRTDMEKLSGMSAEELDNNPEVLMKVGAALRAQLPAQDITPKLAFNDTAPRRTNGRNQRFNSNAQWSGLPDMASYSSFLADQEITESDLAMPRTSESAAITLQEAKDELMARLQDASPRPETESNDVYDAAPLAGPDLEEEIPDSYEGSIMDDEEDEEDDDDEYHNSTDQERGLLTDVPLVLGPTEIEALPMIIQAGIVDNFGGAKASNERQGARNMQAVRCHILLAQEAGRNVLRELLIFIAAWDLPDDEFYFKMMVQIMESILKNGLMSHAYSDFGQAKDIISPAQAVVIKILTHIFRSKYSPSSGQNNNEHANARPKVISALTRVDILTVRYIFTVFRGNIIPETCALIYLQGQIRAGLAMAEDFPLNLWDMERVYEGVYQFLEFFAVLTENNDWKRLLVQWEIVYDLVTLLKELDASIPKAPLMKGGVKSSSIDRETRPVAVPNTVGASTSGHNGTITTAEQLSEADITTASSPQVPPTSAHDQTKTPQVQSKTSASPPKQTSSLPPPLPTPSEHPSTFEWRNLKKLIILVLSSLVWKNPQVQSQIREHSGVETVLSCTNYDGHNPYIKEHAVMCLKFLLEGNKENQDIVQALEAKGVVDPEGVQRDYGVKASVGEDGRVTISGAGVEEDKRSEKTRRIARRMSESSAAAALLGERFADLNVRDGNKARGKRRVVEVTGHSDDREHHQDSTALDGDEDEEDEIEFM